MYKCNFFLDFKDKKKPAVRGNSRPKLKKFGTYNRSKKVPKFKNRSHFRSISNRAGYGI